MRDSTIKTMGWVVSIREAQTCKDANSCQISDCHCVIDEVLGQEMTKCVDKRQKCGQIQWFIFEVKRTEKAKCASQKRPNSKSSSMDFSHYTILRIIKKKSVSCVT